MLCGMLTKNGMLTEDVRIQVGNRSYHNLAHYSPNCRYTGPSIYGAFNSFTPDIFEYDKSGKSSVAKFMPTFAGVGRAKRRIRIPIPKLREEVSELERALWKALENESNVRTIGEEGQIQLRVNEPAVRIRELLEQRQDFLHFYVDMPKDFYIDIPKELNQHCDRHYAGIKLVK